MPEATSSSQDQCTSRIMIVDDHALVRHGLGQLISGEPDLEVCAQAATMDEAMDLLSTNPDLIVVDISLKEGSGIELIKQIKVKHPDVHMLVSSMHDESLFAERALHAGAKGYINKQESTDKVLDAIRHVLDGHIYLSPKMTDRLLHGVVEGQKIPETSSIEKLSDRELQVFELIGQGMSTRQIANQLHLSVKTIETHREHIKSKLNLKNGAELSRHAVRWVLESAG
jgi:DNA-binding NarL/FixJ family response regulator